MSLWPFQFTQAFRRSSRGSAELPPVSRQDAAWLLAGLASSLRKAPPRANLPAQLPLSELLSFLPESGYAVTVSSAQALLDTSVSQSTARWAVLDARAAAVDPSPAQAPVSTTAAVTEPLAPASPPTPGAPEGPGAPCAPCTPCAPCAPDTPPADDVPAAPAPSSPPLARLALLVRTPDEGFGLVYPESAQPQPLTRAELCALVDPGKGEGVLLKLTPLVADPERELELFGWRWFIRAFFARKGVIRDILVASLIVSLVGLGMPLATQAIVDKVITNHATSTLIALGTGVGLMAVLSAVMSWLRQKLLLRLANVVDAELAQRVVLHLLRLPLPFFTGRATGNLINRVHGVERIREFTAGAFLLGALELPFALVFLGLMLSYSPGLSLVVLGFLAVMLVVSFAVGPLLRERADESMQRAAHLQGFLTEQVAAAETLKCLQMEEHVTRRFQALNEGQLDATLRLRELGNTYGTFMQTAEQLMNITVLCLGAYWAMTTSDLTIGMLVAFQMFAQRVTQPLLKLSGMWQELQQVRISARMLGDILNQPTERYSAAPGSWGEGRGMLKVDKMSFAYAPDRPALYENLSFELPPGRTTLVTGPSGCGKSTLAKVLLGMYPQYRGTVSLDGRDLRSMSVNEIRSAFGVVPQESVLFSGTIIDNLLAVSPTATVQQAVAACKMAGIHVAIESMAKGYQTEIGERGAGLSGGQRQRIAIARALLKRPKVLIFDEAVASLDDEAAAHVAAAVNDLAGHVTVLFVTHKVPPSLKVAQHLKLGPAPR